jgi:hypothetical protein
VWFGYWGHTGTLRFDYGAPLLQTYDVGIDYAAMGEYSSLYDMAADYGFDDISYCEDMYSGSYHEPNVYPGARYDLKVSMYLTVPAAYTRTVTQGVTLTDTRKQAGAYKRNVAQTVRGTTAAEGLAGLYRRIVQSVTGAVSLKGPLTLARKLAEAAAALYGTEADAGFSRGITNTVSNSSVTGGMLSFFRTLFGIAGSGDNANRFITRMRVIRDRGTAGDGTGHTADYLRRLFMEAGSIAKTSHTGEYRRKQQDTAHSNAVPLRHLFVFIRLLTGAYIRDYIIGRFLKSREEVVIKSPVCREVTLDSRLH